MGVMFVVRSTALDYHAPARLDDELEVSVVVERLGAASVQFFQEAWRDTPAGRQRLCSGRIRIACVDTKTLRPGAIPAQVLDRIKTSAA
jgi:acyl-CoA thioester hydrolase